MQVDEIARDVQTDQLAFAPTIIDMPEHRPFDDIVGILYPLAPLNQCLAWIEFDDIDDSILESALLIRAKIVSKPAFEE